MQDAFSLALPWLAVIVVFVGMAYLNLRTISSLVQIVVLALGGKTPAAAVPALPISAPKPAPAADSLAVLQDLVKKMLAAQAGPGQILARPPAPELPAPLPTPGFAGAPPWFTLGLKDIGFHEIGDNRGIETFIAQAHAGALGDPWCAIWANAKLEQAGIPGTRSASSQSFTTDPNFVQLPGPALGCIVVYWRSSKQSGVGHVGFYVDETASSIRTLGGNEGDMVQIEALPKAAPTFGLVGFYWPRSVALPGMKPISTPSSSLAHVVAPAALPSPASGSQLAGKMSIFGGPSDSGVAPDEGLALVEAGEVDKFAGFFLPDQPPGTTGLARRLDPKSFYLACRWNYKMTPRAFLQGISVAVTANGKTLQARPIDWGPNENTGRIADLSPGLADALGLKTDDTCAIVIPSQATPAVT